MSPTIYSPRYVIKLPAGTISAGGSYFVDFSRIPECANELPYNNILIRNFSNSKYEIRYGENISIMGASEAYADDEAYGTRTLKITDLSNSAQDDMIFIIVSRDVSEKAAIIAYLTGKNLFEVANGDV